LLGLNEFSVVVQSDDDEVSGQSCAVHADCGESDAQYRCVATRRQCAALRTETCKVVAGPDRDDRSIWIGLVESAQARASIARQTSAALAIDSINAAGGIPFDAAGTEVHPLVLIACDAGRDMLAAAGYLIHDLGVRAIIGPDESQDAFALATKVAIPNDTLVVSPTTTASALADLIDDGLLWSMVPNDAQRAPWMMQLLSALETALQSERDREDLKLAILVRDDAQAQSGRASLQGLTFGGKPLTDSVNLGNRVRVDAYPPGASAHSALVDAYVEFAPDIVIVFGMAETATQIIAPLERAWAAGGGDLPRPEYVLTDAAKVPELINALSRDSELRGRVRGVGATYTDAARDVHAEFVADYQKRDPLAVKGVSGLEATYDAVNAIGLALASQRKLPISGRELANGLRRLSSAETRVELRDDQLAIMLSRTAAGMPLRVVGALGPLAWDERGAPRAGALEVWCVSGRDGNVSFESSGLRAEVPGDPPVLEAHSCAAPDSGRTAVGVPDSRSSDAAVPMEANDDPTDPAPTPDAGVPASGDAAVSGEAPTTPATRPLEMTASIPCGASACDPRAGAYCCVSTLRGLTEDPRPSDFQCRTTPPESANCAVALRCTSDTDCTGGQVCCGAASMTVCDSAAMCSARAGTRLACESSRGCPRGRTCCAHLAPGATNYSNVACETDCSALTQGISLCESDADCAGSFVPMRCTPSRIVPNLKLCVVGTTAN
jgi:ABC-type branched-subunit amino acid transport system substrate-binding protein